MSAPRTYSEKEVVLRERAAFARALYVAKNFMDRSECEARAAREYPLPKVVRPRVVKDPHVAIIEWRRGPVRMVSGDPYPTTVLEWRATEPRPSGWDLVLTAERVALWADLLANPTEEVEDDGSDPVSAEGAS